MKFNRRTFLKAGLAIATTSAFSINSQSLESDVPYFLIKVSKNSTPSFINHVYRNRLRGEHLRKVSITPLEDFKIMCKPYIDLNGDHWFKFAEAPKSKFSTSTKPVGGEAIHFIAMYIWHSSDVIFKDREGIGRNIPNVAHILPLYK